MQKINQIDQEENNMDFYFGLFLSLFIFANSTHVW